MKVAIVKVGSMKPNSCEREKARGNRTKHVFITTVVP
jgi:hypothetical protein